MTHRKGGMTHGKEDMTHRKGDMTHMKGDMTADTYNVTQTMAYTHKRGHYVVVVVLNALKTVMESDFFF